MVLKPVARVFLALRPSWWRVLWLCVCLDSFSFCLSLLELQTLSGFLFSRVAISLRLCSLSSKPLSSPSLFPTPIRRDVLLIAINATVQSSIPWYLQSSQFGNFAPSHSFNFRKCRGTKSGFLVSRYRWSTSVLSQSSFFQSFTNPASPENPKAKEKLLRNRRKDNKKGEIVTREKRMSQKTKSQTQSLHFGKRASRSTVHAGWKLPEKMRLGEHGPASALPSICAPYKWQVH